MKVDLTLLSMGDANVLFEFETSNKEFFEKYVPPRPESYFNYKEFVKILEALLEEQQVNKSLFFLIKNENGEIIGRINLVDIDWITKTGEVGYRVGKDFIGKGAAAKGLELLKSEAVLMGIKEIKAKTTVDNLPSQKVLEKCFFEKDGIDNDGFIHYIVTL